VARLYVFRPDLDDSFSGDEPVLTVDNNLEVTLGRWSYAPLDLALGKHHFRLRPGRMDSKVWHLEGEFDVQAPGRYYLVIWNALETRSGANRRVI
jgi:hypothetical protein